MSNERIQVRYGRGRISGVYIPLELIERQYTGYDSGAELFGDRLAFCVTRRPLWR